MLLAPGMPPAPGRCPLPAGAERSRKRRRNGRLRGAGRAEGFPCSAAGEVWCERASRALHADLPRAERGAPNRPEGLRRRLRCRAPPGRGHPGGEERRSAERGPWAAAGTGPGRSRRARAPGAPRGCGCRAAVGGAGEQVSAGRGRCAAGRGAEGAAPGEAPALPRPREPRVGAENPTAARLCEPLPSFLPCFPADNGRRPSAVLQRGPGGSGRCGLSAGAPGAAQRPEGQRSSWPLRPLCAGRGCGRGEEGCGGQSAARRCAEGLRPPSSRCVTAPIRRLSPLSAGQLTCLRVRRGDAVLPPAVLVRLGVSAMIVAVFARASSRGKQICCFSVPAAPS